MSSTKQTKHINTWYLSISDRVDAGEVDLQYCATEQMVTNFFIKPFQGTLLNKKKEAKKTMTSHRLTLEYPSLTIGDYCPINDLARSLVCDSFISHVIKEYNENH